MLRIALLIFGGAIGLIAVQSTVNIMSSALDVYEHALVLGVTTK